MLTAQRKDFLTGRWVEIVVRVPADAEGPASIINQLLLFRPDFIQHVENLVIKLDLLPLPEIINTTLAGVPSSPGCMLVENIVEEVGQFPALARMNVVLSMPENISNDTHDNQLSYVLPFYKLTFTRWILPDQTPATSLPQIASKDELKRLDQLYDMALKTKKDEDARISETTYKRESISSI